MGLPASLFCSAHHLSPCALLPQALSAPAWALPWGQTSPLHEQKNKKLNQSLKQQRFLWPFLVKWDTAISKFFPAACVLPKPRANSLGSQVISVVGCDRLHVWVSWKRTGWACLTSDPVSWRQAQWELCHSHLGDNCCPYQTFLQWQRFPNPGPTRLTQQHLPYLTAPLTGVRPALLKIMFLGEDHVEAARSFGLWQLAGGKTIKQ